MNAVLHGCKSDAAKTVRLSVTVDEVGGILIVIRDSGEGFDLSKIPKPTEGERLHAAGGRGIFLIHQLLDEIRYERGGTQLRMRKH